MLKKVIFLIINSGWLLLYLIRYLSFKNAISNIESVQQKLLLRILKRNTKSEFGIRYKFSSISTVSDFKAHIPISNYDSYLTYINSICKGKNGVLTNEPILLLQPSGGSTSPSKYIPYTKTLKDEFHRGIAVWIFDLYTKRKKLLHGRAYWSITPAGNIKKKTEGGVPVGFDEDTKYFGFIERFLINLLLVVPEEVNKIEDITAFRYVTLLFLLKAKDLTLISIWNPTFLILLLKPLLDWSSLLLEDIKNGTISSPEDFDPLIKKRLIKKLSKDEKRAEELKGIFEQYSSNNLYEAIWPNLTLISCWADGSAKYYVKELKRCFPNVDIQGKGLLATEGIISFPLIGEEGHILAINSHFFEFIEINEEGNHTIKLAHQLEKDKSYSVIITTGGGLYRYRLFDKIRIVGFKGKCPLIKFIGKEDKISDLFGEKLNEQYVWEVLKKLFRKYSVSPAFFMVAPEKYNDKCFYTLFLELKQKVVFEELDKLTLEFEERLQENYHYKYCRKLGQLSHVRLFIIHSGGLENYIRRCQLLGQRVGNIKYSVLHPKMGWVNEFKGYFINNQNKF